MDTATCRHCGHAIVLGPPSPDPYWYHPRGQSVYCDVSDTAYSARAEPQAARPVTRAHRAWVRSTSRVDMRRARA